MTQSEKTIAEIAAMSGMERTAFLLSLSADERKVIDERELLKAIDAATVKMLVDSLNKNVETDDYS